MGDDFDNFLEKKIAEQEGGQLNAAWAKTFVFPRESVVVSGAGVRLLVDALNRQGGENTLELVEKIPLYGDVTVTPDDARLMRAAWQHVEPETSELGELKAALDRNFG